ncbi:AAA family ATPase [Desulfonatronum thioautotrophicum]|uniref:AAA family ATPase n=1 Tax=Desulfonatronum thioautotrophicum TaxID=617001 RepID=UPI0005EAE82F|nr:AAA family ATPase [Desulfonatronum thioautotrophicum]
MQFPYGISNFQKIATSGSFYVDRTDRIPLLERGEYQLFIRPRRFGKSLLLSTLFSYYDLASAHLFDELFGRLAIGQNPTPLRNRYFMLQLDFSCVDPTGTVGRIRRALHDHVNTCIDSFVLLYGDHLREDVRIDRDNALSSLQSAASVARRSGHPFFLLIDEYDNFANEVMMSAQRDSQRRYEALVFEEGPLRTLFKAMKSLAGQGLIDRIFITGVSPVVMSDITSGFNIAKNIYLNPLLNDLCGFTFAETQHAVALVAEQCGLDENATQEAEAMLRTWYNGYTFSPDAQTMVYNPTLVLYFLDTLEQRCTYPRKMLDANLSTDRAKLEYIARSPGGDQLLLDMASDDYLVALEDIADRFGMRDMLREQSKDSTFMASLLYYFGVLSIEGRTSLGKLTLRVPNLVMRKLYVEQIAEMLLPDPLLRDEGKLAAENLYQKGDMAPLCAYVEEKYFKVFHTADYRWANDLTVKTAFLTLLYNDTLYVMDSEPELERRRADLTMIIRPDARRFTILDILIEFKFVTLKDAGMSGEQALMLGMKELQGLRLMRQAMDEAREQVRGNMKTLNRRYNNLRLRGYAVVSLGFERIWWEEVGREG